MKIDALPPEMAIVLGVFAIALSPVGWVTTLATLLDWKHLDAIGCLLAWIGLVMGVFFAGVGIWFILVGLDIM